MSWIDSGRHFLRAFFARERLSTEMEDEMRFHLELEAQQQGNMADAHLIARKRFGHIGSVMDQRRRASGLAYLDRMLQDASYVWRQVVRSPGFAAAVAVTLAIGVGANTTMFVLIDRLLLRAPDGIVDPERVVLLRSSRQLTSGQRDTSISFSYASFVELRGMSEVFAGVTAVRGPVDVAVDRGSRATSLRGAIVGDDYFQTLGVVPAIGRFFHPDETREPNGVPVAVISHTMWQNRYGGDHDVLGQSVEAAGTGYTIIGVAPAEFNGHSLGRVDLWLPIAASPSLRWGRDDWHQDRGTRWLLVIARLRDGVAPEQALARVGAGWTAWNMRRDGSARPPTPLFASLVPARNSDQPEFRVAILLGGVALLLLLLTSANVANLLLGRALARRREVAIRLALGVSRARLAALFVVDAVFLAFIGGLASLALAFVGVPVVRSVLLAGTATGEWTIDMRSVGFAMTAALLAGLVAGIVPAVQASRPVLLGSLRKTADGRGHRSGVRRMLLITQGALTVSLLVGTGLFVNSLRRVGERQLGLDLDRILVADFSDRGSGYSPQLVRDLNLAMRDRALELPGVESASLSVGVPFEGQYAVRLEIPGEDSIPGMERGRAPFVYPVTPEFFRTMGTRIIAGRGFLPSDLAGAPLIAVVSAAMARQIWPRGAALGQCFRMVVRNQTSDCIRIVGVAEDARRESLTSSDDAVQYYIPLAQAPELLSDVTLLVRSTDPRATVPMLQAAVQGLRSDMPHVHIRTLEDAVARELRPWRLGASVFSLFGIIALIVAAVGTYSVIQFGVSQRRHELGVRIALGARAPSLMGMVLADAARSAVLAGIVGTIVVLAAGPFVSAHLYETSPRDPGVIVAGILVLFVSWIVATLAPAWRATRVDPITALKVD